MFLIKPKSETANIPTWVSAFHSLLLWKFLSRQNGLHAPGWRFRWPDSQPITSGADYDGVWIMTLRRPNG